MSSSTGGPAATSNNYYIPRGRRTSVTAQVPPAAQSVDSTRYGAGLSASQFVRLDPSPAARDQPALASPRSESTGTGHLASGLRSRDREPYGATSVEARGNAQIPQGNAAPSPAIQASISIITTNSQTPVTGMRSGDRDAIRITTISPQTQANAQNPRSSTSLSSSAQNTTARTVIYPQTYAGGLRSTERDQNRTRPASSQTQGTTRPAQANTSSLPGAQDTLSAGATNSQTPVSRMDSRVGADNLTASTSSHAESNTEAASASTSHQPTAQDTRHVTAAYSQSSTPAQDMRPWGARRAFT